jgi:hypothetical protein
MYGTNADGVELQPLNVEVGEYSSLEAASARRAAWCVSKQQRQLITGHLQTPPEIRAVCPHLQAPTFTARA